MALSFWTVCYSRELLSCYLFPFLDLDAVHIDVLAINQSITALRNHALQINSTLLSLLEASDNFTAACNSDFICEEAIPDVPFFCGLDEVAIVH